MALVGHCVFRGCIAELVFFLYKTGEAMLDATIRPHIVKAVCDEMTRDMVITTHHWTLRHSLFQNGSIDICKNLEYFPGLETPVQTRAAKFLMIYRILVNVPAIFLGLLCGAWSDRSGRKLPMMIPSIGSVLAVLLYLSSELVSRYTLLLIMAGSLVQGLMGKSSVITMAVNSYIADTTPSEDRTRKLGKLLAMSFLGYFVGSLLSGTLQDLCNVQVTLVMVVVFHAGSVLTVFLCVEESVVESVKEENHPHPSEETHFFSLRGMRESLLVLVKPRSEGRRTVVVVAFLAVFVNQACKVGEQDVTVLFVQNPPLSWPPSAYGYLLSVDFAVMGGCLLFLLPVMSTVLGMSDISIVILGLCCRLVRMAWAGFCTHTWMVYVSVVIGAMAGIISSALRSLLSKSVNDDEVGKVFALASSGETAAKLVGSIAFINIYSHTMHIWPGLAYACGSGVYFLFFLVMIWLYKVEEKRNRAMMSGLFLNGDMDPKKARSIPTIKEPSTTKESENTSLLPLSSSTANLKNLPAISP